MAREQGVPKESGKQLEDGMRNPLEAGQRTLSGDVAQVRFTQGHPAPMRLRIESPPDNTVTEEKRATEDFRERFVAELLRAFSAWQS